MVEPETQRHQLMVLPVLLGYLFSYRLAGNDLKFHTAQN